MTRRTSLPTNLLSLTLCLGVTIAGCTQSAAPIERDRPADSSGIQISPKYNYTVEESANGAIYFARTPVTGVKVATLAVDAGGKVITFDRGADHLSMHFEQDAGGRLVAAGDANGELFSISMMQGDVTSMRITGVTDEVTRMFALANEAFPDMQPLDAAADSCWWSCLECTGTLVGIGLLIYAVWPLIVPLSALIAEVGVAAFGALTAAELAGLLGISVGLATAIVGPCKNCVSCLMANPPQQACADTIGDVTTSEVAIECKVSEATVF